MTEKLKVSREVADAIEKTVKEGLDFRTAIERHISVLDYALGYEPLETLGVEELATALLVGYEVELTPHEVIADKYESYYKKSFLRSAEHHSAHYLGYRKGIEFTLNTLGITVKGVNDNDNNS